MKITLRDIKVKIPGSERVLFHLSRFEIEPGRKLLIKGESGKGKTTLLHMIAGLFYPAEGFVQIGEYRLNQMNDEQRCHFRRANISIVFQKLNLIEHMTAFENVALSSGPGADSVSGALKAVGLEAVMAQRSSLLSLGEQQRVAVARVLASDGKVILADEPSSSLDEKNAANVIDLLFAASKGKTLIVVSHDQRIENRFDWVLDFSEVVGQ